MQPVCLPPDTFIDAVELFVALGYPSICGFQAYVAFLCVA